MINRPMRTQSTVKTLGTRQQSGFVLVLVVFLIAVLGVAAVAISQLTVDNTAANNQALQKTRAQYFAQSGLEWAVVQILDESSCELTGETNTDFPGLILDVECDDNAYQGDEVILWGVTATARSQNQDPDNEEYVWQRMSAVVER